MSVEVTTQRSGSAIPIERAGDFCRWTFWTLIAMPYSDYFTSPGSLSLPLFIEVFYCS